ncbi:MAG: NYN domain-containing protein [Spongiibacteraceae bacterium]
MPSSQSSTKSQRVSIFVDVQNIYYTCRQAYQANFDYNKFWAVATQGQTLISATAYATDNGDKKQQQFQNILRAIGFTVKLKPMLKRSDGSAKADWDVGIALDVFEQAEQCDKVILLSGDGDFDVLLQRIKQRFNTSADVYGVPALTSDLLIRQASSFIPIDHRLLIKS